jgi:hypothetical protein
MSEKVEAVLNKIEENKKPQEKVKNMSIDESMSNLYIILLQYYKTLTEKEHPLIKLITDVMDRLIELKKSEDKENLIETFDEIHSMAYNNITTIYDYDKEHEPAKIETIEDLNI